MKLLKRISLVWLMLGLLGCGQNTPQVDETRDTILVFGTFVEVILLDVPAERKQAVLDAINNDLAYMHNAYHPWESGPMGRTNHLLSLAGEFTANPSVLPLIIKARQLSEQSGGLFNPAIGKLMRLWGYHDEFPPEGPPPDDAKIKALVAQQPSMNNLRIDGVRINNSNPAVRLDMGAIAKGHALDSIMDRLKTLDVHNAIINTGGDLKVLGRRGDRAWHIGIRDPRGDGVIASLDAHDGEAVFTSGDYERFYEYEGRRYHHIIDPRTGYPADQVRSVTVIHTDGATADAAATALLVAGPQDWPGVAKAMGIEQVMLIDKDGLVYLTPRMQQRIKFEKAIADIKVVALP